MGKVTIIVEDGCCEPLDPYCDGRQAAAKGVVYTPAVGSTGSVEDNTHIQWTSLVAQDARVKLLDPEQTDHELAIEVEDSLVRVSLWTGTEGQLIASAELIAFKINTHPQASAIVRGEIVEGTGYGYPGPDSVNLPSTGQAPGCGKDADQWVKGYLSWQKFPS